MRIFWTAALRQYRPLAALSLAAVAAAAIALLWLSFAGSPTHANDGKATLNSCSAGSIAQPGDVSVSANATNVSADDQGRGEASMYVEFAVTGGNGYSEFRVSSATFVTVGASASFGYSGIHVPDSGSYTLTCEVFTTVDGLPGLGDTSTASFHRRRPGRYRHSNTDSRPLPLNLRRLPHRHPRQPPLVRRHQPRPPPLHLRLRLPPTSRPAPLLRWTRATSPATRPKSVIFNLPLPQPTNAPPTPAPMALSCVCGLKCKGPAARL